jgi:UDP-galactopyranose mutase
LVRIADEPEDFIAAVEAILAEDDKQRSSWLKRVDAFLSGMSWDETWARMSELIDNAVAANAAVPVSTLPAAGLKSIAATTTGIR